MKLPRLSVPVDEIPEPGLEIAADFDADWVSDSLLPPYRAVSPLKAHMVVKRIGDTVHVEGVLQIDLAFECSRTLVPGKTTLRIHLGELFQPESAHKLKLGAGVESEELEGDEPYTYEGKVIELEPFIREQLVLAQEPYPRVDPSEADDGPFWADPDSEVDPRWAKLRDLTIN